MKRCFIFCHGFGFDSSFWDNLRPYFKQQDCYDLDLGYFGEPLSELPESEESEFIGIGHSLGFSKLLALKINFKYLIGLNGFVNFLGRNSALNNKRKAELDMLKEHFNLSPVNTLKNFYKRCGVAFSYKKLANLNKDKLLIELDDLSKNIDVPHLPILIISATEDVITPLELIEDNFFDCKKVRVETLNSKHGLGFLNAPVVYQRIRSFLNDQ